jgi:hypothetical protein
MNRRPWMLNTTTRREILPPNEHDDCSSSVIISSSGGCKSHTHDVDGRASTSQFVNKKQRLYIRRRQIGGVATVSIIAVSIIAVSIAIIQFHAYTVEYQGPLDHITTSLVEPYYGMFCPKISNIDETLEDSHHDDVNQSTINHVISWDCNNSDGPTIQDTFPRIFMIGARDTAEDTFQDWDKTLNRINSKKTNDDNVKDNITPPRLERINTLDISNQYALSGNDLCQKIKWEHRLFAVYQSIFINLLVTYPNDSGFIIIEDDAILHNPSYFRRDVCYAQHHEIDFYSLYRSPIQLRKRWMSWWKSASCIYQHGTVAFYIRRSIMEKIVNEHRQNYFCRFPIDMYISKLGPWYATQREIVGHSNMRRVGSTT